MFYSASQKRRIYLVSLFFSSDIAMLRMYATKRRLPTHQQSALFSVRVQCVMEIPEK